MNSLHSNSLPPFATWQIHKAALASVLALVAAGCGGGGGGDSATADESVLAASLKRKGPKAQPDPAPAPAPAPAPTIGQELLQNPSFGSGLQSWTVSGLATLVPSEVRTGGQALRVDTSDVSQQIPAGTLQPGKSYSYVVKARLAQAGEAGVVVRFYSATDEAFRTFKSPVTSTSYSDVRVDFTVPAYADKAYVTLDAGKGTPLVVDSASLKEREPIAQTEPVTSTADSYVPPGYTLAFNDEFNGTELNRNKWFTRYIYAAGTMDRLNDEQQRYRDNNNHVVANGVLNLVARKVSSNDQWGINYESGMIRSDWTTHYGYFEARVKMPGGKGVWPAFWLNGDVDKWGWLNWPPEIDIFEYVVDDLHEHRWMIHNNVHLRNGEWSPTYYTDPAWNEQYRVWYASYNFNERWVTVGAEWGPGYVKNFIDGKLIVHRYMKWDESVGPAHILLNLAIGGSWAGRNGIDDTAFPQALQVDWVRAYKKAN